MLFIFDMFLNVDISAHIPDKNTNNFDINKLFLRFLLVVFFYKNS